MIVTSVEQLVERRGGKISLWWLAAAERDDGCARALWSDPNIICIRTSMLSYCAAKQLLRPMLFENTNS